MAQNAATTNKVRINLLPFMSNLPVFTRCFIQNRIPRTVYLTT